MFSDKMQKLFQTGVIPKSAPFLRTFYNQNPLIPVIAVPCNTVAFPQMIHKLFGLACIFIIRHKNRKTLYRPLEPHYFVHFHHGSQFIRICLQLTDRFAP